MINANCEQKVGRKKQRKRKERSIHTHEFPFLRIIMSVAERENLRKKETKAE
jgi:hypothetical protein